MLHEVIGVFQPSLIAACSQKRRKHSLVFTQYKSRVQPRQTGFRQFRTAALQKNILAFFADAIPLFPGLPCGK